MNIVVLSGGLSIERDVSLCTGSLVQKALIKKGHNAILIDVIKDYIVEDNNYTKYIEDWNKREMKKYSVSSQAPDIDKLIVKIQIRGKGVFGENVLNLCMASDMVFMALHGGEGENGKIQATFDMFGIKYTGSDYLGSAVAMSKRFTKQVFETNSILSPKYRTLLKKDYTKTIIDEIELPSVVKLSSGGSSLGVYIVHNKDELKKAFNDGFAMEDTLIIEEYVKGVEYTCGVLDNVSLPIVEIVPKHSFYDYESKYQKDATFETCPAPSLNVEQTKQMQDIALKAHMVLGLDVYSRTDFIVNDKDEMYCLETNTLPGMTPTSLLPQEALAVGISYEELCHTMVMLSLEKYK